MWLTAQPFGQLAHPEAGLPGGGDICGAAFTLLPFFQFLQQGRAECLRGVLTGNGAGVFLGVPAHHAEQRARRADHAAAAAQRFGRGSVRALAFRCAQGDAGAVVKLAMEIK